MPSLFLPKHQKLILQCYPPGKDTEKKPNSSELSYLLYYASTRRVKLEKVITFLNKKTSSDANRNRVGNLQVTLAIVSSLIDKCSDNLNVFAEQAIGILETALKPGGIALGKAVLSTYGVLCRNLDGGLFAGDKSFVKALVRISERLINLGANNKTGPSALEWQMISLMCIRSLSYCLSNSPEVSALMMKKVLPPLIDTFHENSTDDSLHRYFSNEGVESIKLSKVQSRKTLKAEKQIEEDLENDIVDKEDLYEESVAGLRSIFNTSMVNQISEATDTVVQYTYNTSKYTRDWSETFLELCTTWVPVQLRFVVLNTLVSKLRNLSAKEIDLQKAFGHQILGLVSSKVNMIGLSISDLIQSLLGLKQSVYFEQAGGQTEENIKELSDIYSKSIVNLSTHIYYYDQVPDSVYEIFLKIESTLRYADNKMLFYYIITLLDDVEQILYKLGDHSSKSAITRNHIGIEQWQVSLSLIAPKASSTLYNNMSEVEATNIQSKYYEIFYKFLDSELIPENEDTPENTEISLDTFSDPDFNQLISESTNFLSHFLVDLDKYLNNNVSMDFDIIKQILEVAFKLSDIFGINFLNNFIPFFFHWTLKDFHDQLTPKDLAKDTFAQAVFERALSTVDNKYKEELQDYSLNSKLYKDVKNNTEYRVSQGYWVQEIIEKTSFSSNTQNAPITSKEVNDYARGNVFLSKWVNAQKLLILNILPDELLNGNTSKSHNGNGAAHQNGNGQVHGSNGYSNGTADANITIQSSSSSTQEYSEARPGLGLGSTADIASIHSGIRNTTLTSTILGNNSFDFTNGSILTNDKLRPPKVSDLKVMLTDYSSRKPSSINEASSTVTPGSVLSKQMVTHDVDSILEGLDDDESFIV